MLFTMTGADQALGKMQMLAQTPERTANNLTLGNGTKYSLPQPYYTSQY